MRTKSEILARIRMLAQRSGDEIGECDASRVEELRWVLAETIKSEPEGE